MIYIPILNLYRYYCVFFIMGPTESNWEQCNVDDSPYSPLILELKLTVLLFFVVNKRMKLACLFPLSLNSTAALIDDEYESGDEEI